MPPIYVLGDGSSVAAFHPESVAISLCVNSYYPNDSSLSIIPNSNIQGSYTGKLPFLVTDTGKQIHGYKRIVKFVQSNYTTSTPPLTGEQKLLDAGFTEYLLESFNVITYYNLFLNKENYVGYSRPLFKELVPFPLQYKPPIDFRSEAMKICEGYGISADDSFSEENSEEMDNLKAQERELKETPILNDLQKTQVDKSLELITIKKSLLTNMKCISMLSDIIETYRNLQLAKNSPAELLFFGFIKSNTLPELSSRFVYEWMHQNCPELLQKADSIFLETHQSEVVEGSLSLLSAARSGLETYI